MRLAQRADKIAVFAEGKLDFIGSHAEVLAKSKAYQRLVSIDYDSFGSDTPFEGWKLDSLVSV